MDILAIDEAAGYTDQRVKPVSRRQSVPCMTRALPPNRVGTASLSNGSLQGTTFRVYPICTVSGHDVQVRYANIYNNNGVEADGPNAVTYKASIEYESVLIPITWGGSLTVTVGPGQVSPWSDPLPIDVKKGTAYPIRTYVSVGTLGDKWPQGITAQPAVEGSSRSNTDLTTPGSAGVAAVQDPLVHPSDIRCKPNTPPEKLIEILSDSIGAGLNETPPNLDRGFIVRALGIDYSYHHVGQPSDLLISWSSTFNFYKRRSLWLADANVIVCALGANNMIGSDLNSLQIAYLTIWKRYAARGIEMHQTTITPRNASTDGWITVANQTPNASSEPNRLALNGWLRDGAPIDPVTKNGVAVGTAGALRAAVRNQAGVVITPATGGHPLLSVLDVSDTVETARNSGRWKPAERVVTDMVATSGQATISSATANFTAADQYKNIAIIGAGASGGVLVSTIASVQSATQATLMTFFPNTTVSGATAGIGTSTIDGLHPATRAHIDMAAAVPTSIFGATTV